MGINGCKKVKRMTAVFLAAFLALETGACGSGGMSADNSGETVGSEEG